MFKQITNGCVNLVNRWLPDAFLFAVILTFVVFLGALVFTGQGPVQVLANWGNDKSFWGLLTFSMQMVLILVLGGAMATAKPFQKFLGSIAGLATTPRSAIIITVLISGICMFFNWGFGLIAGALLAKEIARRVKVDYRLIIASSYSAFSVWHGGISGSIPLSIAGKGVVEKMSGGLIQGAIPVTETIFHPMNLIIEGVMLVAIALVCAAMHPDEENTVLVDPSLLAAEEERVHPKKVPADKIEQSKIIWGLLCVMVFAYIVYNFAMKGFNLSLNSVNFIFLGIGLLLHGNLRNYIDAIVDNAKGSASIIIQFPFYAGIMGIMISHAPGGQSLAQMISNFFVSISTPNTYPLFTYLSAGIVNFFVPSGGGQWAVQGPIVMPGAYHVGASAALSAQALAYGDAWTNMIQPFWALPALGVAGLSARDIMGYCIIVLIVCAIVTIPGLYIWATLF